MSCDDETGNIVGPDGLELSFDGLPNTNFRVIFPKAPFMTMFLQEFTLPEISVTEVPVPTPFVNTNEIGEKLNYSPFTCKFLIDKKMKNFREIHSWMERMTVAGSSIGEVDNPTLIINGIEMIQFMGVWPTSIGELRFVTTNDDVVYLEGIATFAYDYLVFM